MAFQRETLKLNYEKNDKLKKDEKCYVFAPIDKFGVFGRWIRHKLLDGILVGTPVLLTIQKHRTTNRTVLMKTLSFLGTENFYTLFIISLLWLFDGRLARLFAILMWLGFYTTGYLKTLLCLPRPPHPPVMPLEKTFDWALPSLHSLLGVIMPWYIWLYAVLHYELSPFHRGTICLIIVLWSFGVLLSRLYLGVHSPADIVSGGIVGVVVLSLWMQMDDYVDWYISQQNLEAQLKLIIFIVFMLCFHPVTEPGNPSFTDTVCVFGVISGIILGRSQRSRLLGMPPLMDTLEDFTISSFVIFSILRLVIGGLLIQLIRVTLKFVLTFLIGNIYHLIGLSVFNSSTFRKTLPANCKHYTEEFRLPPVYVRKSDLVRSDDDVTMDSDEKNLSDPSPSGITNDEASRRKWYDCIQLGRTIHCLASWSSGHLWDVTIPMKYFVYCAVSFAAMEHIPRLFFFIGI